MYAKLSLFKHGLTGLMALTLLLFVCGCATKGSPQLADLEHLPQDATVYSGLPADTPLLTREQQLQAYDRFMQAHFAPWDREQPAHSAEDAFWALDRYAGKALFGANTLPLPQGWLDTMRRASRVDDYPSMGGRAIAVTNTSMRALPTSEPVFYDFSQAGEGFPFDYMQNSLVLAGTPLYATHMSLDRAWVLVESRFTYGWVPARDIAWVNDQFEELYRSSFFVAITTDDLPLADCDHHYRFTGHIGTILPLLEGGPDGYITVLLPARTADGQATPRAGMLPESVATIMPLETTPANFARLINVMLGRTYGWGGLYEGRDCSAAIMDLMATFGIFLPRNSSQQIKEGTQLSFEGMDAEDKKEAIVQNGTPFLTLIRKPGHIMLYIGESHDEPIIFHAVWGLKTKDGDTVGRYVIGRAVITTLEPGEELDDLARPEGLLINQVSKMTTLP